VTSRQEGEPARSRACTRSLVGRLDLPLEDLGPARGRHAGRLRVRLPPALRERRRYRAAGARRRSQGGRFQRRLPPRRRRHRTANWHGHEHPDAVRGWAAPCTGLPELFRSRGSPAAAHGRKPLVLLCSTSAILAPSAGLRRTAAWLRHPTTPPPIRKSGVSGGRPVAEADHALSRSATRALSAYNVGRHRHTPEIEQVVAPARRSPMPDVISTPRARADGSRHPLHDLHSPHEACSPRPPRTQLLRDAYAGERFAAGGRPPPRREGHGRTRTSATCTARVVRGRVLLIGCSRQPGEGPPLRRRRPEFQRASSASPEPPACPKKASSAMSVTETARSAGRIPPACPSGFRAGRTPACGPKPRPPREDISLDRLGHCPPRRPASTPRTSSSPPPVEPSTGAAVCPGTGSTAPVAINSGNADACTGSPRPRRDAAAMAAAAAATLAAPDGPSVLVLSTGHHRRVSPAAEGRGRPRRRWPGPPGAAMTDAGGRPRPRGMMTTDTRPKLSGLDRSRPTAARAARSSARPRARPRSAPRTGDHAADRARRCGRRSPPTPSGCSREAARGDLQLRERRWPHEHQRHRPPPRQRRRRRRSPSAGQGPGGLRPTVQAAGLRGLRWPARSPTTAKAATHVLRVEVTGCRDAATTARQIARTVGRQPAREDGHRRCRPELGPHRLGGRLFGVSRFDPAASSCSGSTARSSSATWQPVAFDADRRLRLDQGRRAGKRCIELGRPRRAPAGPIRGFDSSDLAAEYVHLNADYHRNADEAIHGICPLGGLRPLVLARPSGPCAFR